MILQVHACLYFSLGFPFSGSFTRHNDDLLWRPVCSPQPSCIQGSHPRLLQSAVSCPPVLYSKVGLDWAIYCWWYTNIPSTGMCKYSECRRIVLLYMLKMFQSVTTHQWIVCFLNNSFWGCTVEHYNSNLCWIDISLILNFGDCI